MLRGLEYASGRQQYIIAKTKMVTNVITLHIALARKPRTVAGGVSRKGAPLLFPPRAHRVLAIDWLLVAQPFISGLPEAGRPARASPCPNADSHEPSGDVAALRSEIYTETREYRANKDSLRGQIAVSS